MKVWNVFGGLDAMLIAIQVLLPYLVILVSKNEEIQFVTRMT